MASYKYLVDCGYYTTYAKVEIRPNYRRFHSMCAQESFEVLRDANDETRIFKAWSFVSYDTPICRVWYDSKWDVWYYTVNAEYFNHSNSTIHQFSRWLREHTSFISYMSIKHLSQQPKSGTPDISTISYANNVHVSFCSDDYIRDVFNW